MKNLYLFSLLFLLLSCNTEEEIVKNKEENKQDLKRTNRIVGTVHTTTAGCLFYISTKNESGNINMYPINLDDKFKEDGLFIRFTYNLSRGMQPEGCYCNQVVSVSDITRLRKQEL